MLVALTYGCNLGPHQAARHLSGRVSAHELGSTFRRHVTVAALNKAIADVVDAYLELDLAEVWGDASAVAVDGTKYEIYVDNLVAEYHIRYGGYGAIAYHYVADNYIALFSRFFPCGVWEAVCIVDGLLQQQSKAEPEEIHADTQGQSFPVFGLAYLFGFDLLPRIRNFKDRVFFRPDPEVTYTHIDALFGEPINWKLIESHWEDLMRVAISIRQGKLSSVTLLRRLRHDSKRNKIYRAFRELGRVVSTMVLLRYISDPVVRGHVSKATTMVESFNGFAKWLNFGNATIEIPVPAAAGSDESASEITKRPPGARPTGDLTALLADYAAELAARRCRPRRAAPIYLASASTSPGSLPLTGGAPTIRIRSPHPRPATSRYATTGAGCCTRDPSSAASSTPTPRSLRSTTSTCGAAWARRRSTGTIRPSRHPAHRRRRPASAGCARSSRSPHPATGASPSSPTTPAPASAKSCAWTSATCAAQPAKASCASTARATRSARSPSTPSLGPGLEQWLTERAAWPGANTNPALFLNTKGGRLSARAAGGIIAEQAALDDDPTAHMVK